MMGTGREVGGPGASGAQLGPFFRDIVLLLLDRVYFSFAQHVTRCSPNYYWKIQKKKKEKFVPLRRDYN
jgi:hypothetical protein